MTTDHGEVIRFLRNLAPEAERVGVKARAKMYRAAADALESLGPERTVTINDTAVEAMAEALISVVAEVNGIDRENFSARTVVADSARQGAKDLLEAAYAAQNPEGDTRG